MREVQRLGQEIEQEPKHIVQSNGRHSPLLTHMMNKRVKSNVKQVIHLYDEPPTQTEQEPDWKDEVMEQQEETILWQAKRIAELIDTTPQRTEQEPVAWVNKERNTITWDKLYPDMDALYTHPALQGEKHMTHIIIDRVKLEKILEVLEENHHLIEEHERSEYLALYDRQITAIKQALAAPATQRTEQEHPVYSPFISCELWRLRK
jgi:hypothetical protein